MKNLLSYSYRVRAIIFNKQNQILLIKKAINKKEFWTLPGGGINNGESMEVAVKREVLEEVGVTISISKLVLIREIQIPCIYKGFEFFFCTNFVFGDIVIDNTNEQLPTIDAVWLDLTELKSTNIKPTFLKHAILNKFKKGKYIYKEYTPVKYVSAFGKLPNIYSTFELVHVMFKPDAVEAGLVNVIIDDLVSSGALLIDKFDVYLNEDQIKVIYSDIKDKNIFSLIKEYLFGKKTVHCVFKGKPGTHELLNKMKGRVGSDGYGIRMKYVHNYTHLNRDQWNLWINGKHPNQVDINKEMFCYNLLHVANDQVSSLNGLDIIYKNR